MRDSLNLLLFSFLNNQIFFFISLVYISDTNLLSGGAMDIKGPRKNMEAKIFWLQVYLFSGLHIVLKKFHMLLGRAAQFAEELHFRLFGPEHYR
jgi:hypothetical protein